MWTENGFRRTWRPLNPCRSLGRMAVKGLAGCFPSCPAAWGPPLPGSGFLKRPAGTGFSGWVRAGILKPNENGTAGLGIPFYLSTMNERERNQGNQQRFCLIHFIKNPGSAGRLRGLRMI
ncbi:MAG: hypothetical protein C6P37_03285 [Caldibacillus debilis]|uniref:Uncharacterized protein n=1 Tax=Caldibacillus debilis TaxID=301148 RepID=A0A3E0K7D7_9BACI|nr:MAG: hypothetical protein BAA03_14240 [Caldibacillus debilis]REJ30482.1 MAG: hypothetical protein C6P37_03285 [Caldibacillus debilis]